VQYRHCRVRRAERQVLGIGIDVFGPKQSLMAPISPDKSGQPGWDPFSPSTLMWEIGNVYFTVA
jgi:hypothetical protein